MEKKLKFREEKEEGSPPIKRSKAENLKTKQLIGKPGRSCLASSKNGAWLVFVDKKSNGFWKCFLWNCRSHFKVRLPSLLHDPDSFCKCVVFRQEYPPSCFCDQDHDFLNYRVIFLPKNDSSFIWCSPGKRAWIRICFPFVPTGSVLCDVFPLNSETHGSNSSNMVLCAVKYTCGILFISLNLVNPVLSQIQEGSLLLQSPKETCDQESFRHQLVNYNDRELFLVKYKLSMSIWEILKLDFSHKNWETVRNLEGLAIFLRGNYSAACLMTPPDLFGLLKGNCIYLTDECNEDNLFIYDLKDQSLSVYQNQPDSGFPIWFTKNSHGIMGPWNLWLRFADNRLKNRFTSTEADDFVKEMLQDEDGGLVLDDLNISTILPDDIQRLIVESLVSATDYSNCRATCKRWRKIARPICWKPDCSGPSPVELPWLMLLEGRGDITTFIDPIDSMIYYKSTPEFLSCEIRYSNDGWLLVTRGLRSVFFFEPISKTEISIRDFPMDINLHCHGMCFSSSPTASNWVVIALFSREDYRFIMVLSAWTEKWENFGHWFMGSGLELRPSVFYHPIVCKDAFYWLVPDGYLSRFRWRDRDVMNLSVYDVVLSKFYCDTDTERYLVCFQDELYLVVVGYLGRFVRVYKLDVPLKEWIEVKSLDSVSFFITQTSSIAVPTSGKALQNSINLSMFAKHTKYLISYDTHLHKFRCSYGHENHSVKNPDDREELKLAAWIQPKVVPTYRQIS